MRVWKAGVAWELPLPKEPGLASSVTPGKVGQVVPIGAAGVGSKPRGAGAVTKTSGPGGKKSPPRTTANMKNILCFLFLPISGTQGSCPHWEPVGAGGDAPALGAGGPCTYKEGKDASHHLTNTLSKHILSILKELK